MTLLGWCQTTRSECRCQDNANAVYSFLSDTGVDGVVYHRDLKKNKNKKAMYHRSQGERNTSESEVLSVGLGG